MKIAQADGVRIIHPTSGDELWLAGNIDYVVIEYEDRMDNRDRLLAPGGFRRDVFDISKGLFLLVQVKWRSLDQTLLSCIPEAVSQAIALLRAANLPEVRFCLSDGQSWIFFILKSENGTLTYYESAVRRLSRCMVEISDVPLREIMQLVCEWLKPNATGLFTLD